ncbi:hypothetical protein [Bosea sp. (in: a-proteobacteria)]|uniref:hypothetical protein n=1 Tax=Bosea sp. (in: a-proteobacteria) TaxID=1871050 RepID=UPI001AD3E162|nr:hypothetical protein [Bosea sp. (in: a-proteobacteria)]MBN9444378.1 hypothetical protein [Bosea sp. (in: a-proteobacteria)]
MTIVALAARVIFTRLVRGQTFAGDLVENAPLEPIDAVTRSHKPAIAVYTGVLKGKPTGRNALGAGREAPTMELVFQLYVPPADADGDLEGLSLQRSGSGLAIDLMQRQVLSALQSQSNDWHELWSELVVGYDDFDSKPVLIEIEGGARIPCREVTLTCRVINDPAPGAPLNPFWAKFDGILRSDGEESTLIADLIMQAVERPGELSSWRQVMALLGLSRRAVVAGGLGPVEPPLAGNPDPATLEEVTTYPSTIETVVSPGDSISGPEDQ